MRTILWSDWPYLFKYRRQLVSLDNILLLTCGKPLSMPHLLFAIHPMDYCYTGVYEGANRNEKIIAQIRQSEKHNTAHINFYLEPNPSNSKDLVILLEGLIKEAGGWGAKQVAVDVEINSHLFGYFRNACFSVLAKQKVFKIEKPEQTTIQEQDKWRVWNSSDINPMRQLYHALVPPLIQSVEPLTRGRMLGLVYYDDKGSLQAYADLVYGPVGIWVLPIIHPQVKVDIVELLRKMVSALPDQRKRPIYLSTWSYQPWVEQGLLDIPTAPGPEQALMVRYIALQQRVKAEFSLKSLDNSNREPTVPYAPVKRSN